MLMDTIAKSLNINPVILSRYGINILDQYSFKINHKSAYIVYNYVNKTILDYSGANDDLESLLIMLGIYSKVFIYNCRLIKIEQLQYKLNNELDTDIEASIMFGSTLSILRFYANKVLIESKLIRNVDIAIKEFLIITLDDVRLFFKFETYMTGEEIFKIRKLLAYV